MGNKRPIVVLRMLRKNRKNQPHREPETTVSEERLRQIYAELRHIACVCEMGGVLTPLTDAELETIYEDFLDQYGEELALGALERSEWMRGTFVISANHESICVLRTALDAMRSEIERRRTALPATPYGILN